MKLILYIFISFIVLDEYECLFSGFQCFITDVGGTCE